MQQLVYMRVTNKADKNLSLSIMESSRRQLLCISALNNRNLTGQFNFTAMLKKLTTFIVINNIVNPVVLPQLSLLIIIVSNYSIL